MSKMDENAFRRMVGAKEKVEESPEEARARVERRAEGNPTVGEVMRELPDLAESWRRHYLNLYGLNDAYTEEEKAATEASRALMSEGQKKQFRKAVNAYDKHGFNQKDAEDASNNLASFAATNPPEVLRRHVWRLQRGLDEPLFGKAPEQKPNRVRAYRAAVSVSLCARCAEELERETEEAGAESTTGSGERLGNFYEVGDLMVGFYLFKYEEMYVERDRTLFSFPIGEPKECARCGVDDVALWRERFGEKG